MSEASGPLLVVEAVERGLKVTGELDSSSVPLLSPHLDPFPDHDVTLDLSGVDFMDSSGLRVLIDAHLRAEACGRRLVLSHPSRAVARLLEVSGAGSVLAVEHPAG